MVSFKQDTASKKKKKEGEKQHYFEHCTLNKKRGEKKEEYSPQVAAKVQMIWSILQQCSVLIFLSQ